MHGYIDALWALPLKWKQWSKNNLFVFDRNGRLVYKQDSYGIGNNLFYGFSNIGSDFELKSGSYIYVFEFFHEALNETIIKKGFLTISND